MEHDIFQAIYAALIAFAINVIISPVIIPYLKKLNFGQNIREDGPKTHLVKQGTPSMGGIAIILSIIAASMFFLRDNTDGLIILFVSLGYGLIGFMDDYIKKVKRRSLGLRAYQKIIAQFFITTVFVYYLWNSKSNFFDLANTAVYLPFTGGRALDLGLLYIPFVYIVMLGTVNGVNLTDGLDGLAAGVTILVAVFFAITAWVAGSGATPIAGAAVGSLLGFLLFNSYPSKVIMGDTGAFALGGFVAAIALILRMPLFIVVVGIIYVLECLSDIIQVGYFKISGGKRIFKMAPLHHHFELSGWPETKVVALFYVITAIACLIGFIGARAIFA